jgi:VanZ family protein
LYDFPNGDKLGHFLLYGILSLLLNLAFLSRPSVNPARTIWTVSLVLSILIGLEEWSQSLFDSRTMDIVDLLASYAGVTVFALLAWWMRKRK